MAEIDMGAVYKRLWDNDFIALRNDLPQSTFEKFLPFMLTSDVIIKDSQDGDTARRRTRIYLARANDEAELPFLFVVTHLWLLGIEDSFVVPAFASEQELAEWRRGMNLPVPAVRRKLYTAVTEEYERKNTKSVCAVGA